MDLCRHLRWKGYHEDSDGDELALVVLGNRAHYQCLHTCQPWGTDGDVAAPEACVSERPCFTGRDLPVSPELLAALAQGPDADG